MCSNSFYLIAYEKHFPPKNVWNLIDINKTYLTGLHRISRQIIPMSNKTIYELNWLRIYKI